MPSAKCSARDQSSRRRPTDGAVANRPVRPGDVPIWLPQRLRQLGYTSSSVARLLGAATLDDVGLLGRPAALQRARSTPGAAATLTRLFFLEANVSPSELHACFGSHERDSLVRARLLRRRGELWQARLRLDPFADLYLLADRRFTESDRAASRLPPGGPVYPTSSDTALLHAALPEGDLPPGPRLDLCAGSGALGLALTRGRQPLIAVDIDPRAVAMVQRNAALNDIATVTAVVGDLYSALPRGQRYAAIVANPPFVSSPYADGPAFHAGGAQGDRVLRRILRGLEQRLLPDGWAACVSHVGRRRGTSLEQMAQAWFRGFRGAVRVTIAARGSAIDLAAAQAQFALVDGLAAYEREVERWMTYLRRRRIEEILAVLVTARRHGEPTLEVVDACPRVLPIPIGEPATEQVRRWLGTSVEEAIA